MKRLTISFALTAILVAGVAHAQTWQMLASYPGVSAFQEVSGLGLELRGSDRLDFDGDGIADRPFISKDGSEMTVVSGANQNQRWSWGMSNVPNGIIAQTDKVRGERGYPYSVTLTKEEHEMKKQTHFRYLVVDFIDFDGQSGSNGEVKDVLLAQKSGRRYVNPVVLYNIDPITGTSVSQVFDKDTVLVGVVDDNGDGRQELIIGDSNKQEVQVWGLR